MRENVYEGANVYSLRLPATASIRLRSDNGGDRAFRLEYAENGVWAELVFDNRAAMLKWTKRFGKELAKRYPKVAVRAESFAGPSAAQLKEALVRGFKSRAE
jgi:hypothetical protein